MEEENIYGANAVTGSKEDAKALEGRDVEIKTTNTQTVVMKPDDQPQDTQEGEGDKPQEEEETPEQKLAKDVQGQIQAEEDAKKDLEAKGVQWEKLSDEYESTGVLSAESLAALEKAGYPKSVVDAYIKGMEATATQFENQVMGYAGGKEQFQQVTGFIQSQGTAYVNAFNSAIQSGDLTQIKITIEGFKAQMTQKYGTSNRTIMGKGNVQTGTKGYGSKAEMTQAMSDSRYGRDPAYTKEVEMKTARSRFL